MAMSKTVVPGKKRTFLEWARSRDGQKVFVMIAFMVIPLVLLFTFTYLPFAEMFGFSFYKMKYVGERKFVGLKNYVKAEPLLYGRFNRAAGTFPLSGYRTQF